MSTYRVIAAWNRHQWTGRVEDADHNHRGDVTAERYEDIGTNARALLVSQGNDVPDDAAPIPVTAHLPQPAERALQDAEQVVTRSARPAAEAVRVLRQVGILPFDIAALLAMRDLQVVPPGIEVIVLMVPREGGTRARPHQPDQGGCARFFFGGCSPTRSGRAGQPRSRPPPSEIRR